MMNIHIKSLGAPYPESEGMRSRGKALMEAYLENKPFAGLLPDQDPVVLPEIEHRPIKPYDRAVFADILGLMAVRRASTSPGRGMSSRRRSQWRPRSPVAP